MMHYLRRAHRPRRLQVAMLSGTVLLALLTVLQLAYAVVHAQAAVVDTTPPSTPTSLYATSDDTRIRVDWFGGLDGGSPVIYMIYRDGEFLGSTLNHDYWDSVEAGSTHTYYVKGVDFSNNESAPTATVSVTAQPDTTPPKVNWWQVATRVSLGQNWISDLWATDKIGIDRVDVLRDGVPITSYSAAGAYSFTGGPFLDSGLALGESHSYSYVAVDVRGNASAPSPALTVAYTGVAPAAATPVSISWTGAAATSGSSAAKLMWNPSVSDAGIASYAIDARPVGGAFDPKLHKVVTGRLNAYNLEGNPIYTTMSIPNDTTRTGLWQFVITATDNSGLVSPQSNAVVLDLTPPTVGDISKVGEGADLLSLSWAPVGTTTAVRYELSRNSVVVATTTAASYTDAGLAVSTNYTYKACAFDANNRSICTANKTLYIGAAPDVSAPSIRSNWYLNEYKGAAHLSSMSASDNGAVDHMVVYRDGAAIQTLALTCWSTGPSYCGSADMSYFDSNVSPGETHSYTYRVWDKAGNVSNYAPALSVTIDGIAPTPATGLKIVWQDATNAVATWTAGSDNVGLVDNGLWYGPVGGPYSNLATTAYSAGSAMSATFAVQLVMPTVMELVVGSRDKAGFTVYSAPFKFDRSLPTAPGAFGKVSQTATTIKFKWAASKSSTAVTYKVYRSGLLAGSTAGYSWTATLPLINTNYPFKVCAVNLFLAMKCTAVKQFMIDTIAPAVPSGLVATWAVTSGVTLTWLKPADNVGATKYKVFRDGAYLKTVTALKAVDASAIAGAHTYRVAAMDAMGNTSAQSLAATVTVS